MEKLKISTITSILKLSVPIDLKSIYDTIPISQYIPFIEYGANNIPRGFSKKALKKKRKKKVKKIFFNQATMHVVYDGKIMNVKLFNNGHIQITGLKKTDQGKQLIHELIDYLQDFEIFEKEVSILDEKLVLINSDFDMGFEINREVLHSEILNSGIYSSYEPCIYPGVNIKYFINTNNWDGICCCGNRCDGKGRANGDGDCKKITIAVFKSGKIIITGGQHTDQLETAYYFIKEFIEERKELFMLK